MANKCGLDQVTVQAYHEQTKHRPGFMRRSPQGVAGFVPMDPWNRPTPFKRYTGALLRPLETNLAIAGIVGPPAIEVLAGRAHPDPATLRTELLARFLFFSGGVTRVLEDAGRRLYFRAAASAGNLHPLETYVVCSDLPGLGAGVYHFAPDVYALELLRDGDYRGLFADATADTALATTSVGLIVTGIPWRTAWKYGERGWRHLYWDVGTMLANLIAVGEAHGIDVRLSFGFRDGELCRLLDIDGVTEFPLVVVSLRDSAVPTTPTQAKHPRVIAPLRLQTTPLSHAPIEFPLITAAQRAGTLDSWEDVQTWRAATPQGAAATSSTVDVRSQLPHADEPIEAVILRRGSTRAMRHTAVPTDLLLLGMRYAARPVVADAIPAGRTLLRHLLSVHAVDGIPAGQYEFHNGELRLCQRLPDQQARNTAAFLCLHQELGGSSAYTAFLCTQLRDILDALGDRGYRVVQTEAGIAAGRLQLSAFAFGYGATALTFYDDEVAANFASTLECMIACAVGVPAYRSRPGGLPLHPVRLGVVGR
jgi:SagB-type dehydrogenase family enzyme